MKGCSLGLLRDRHFLKELEADCVDSELLEEVLQEIHRDPPLTRRQRVAKWLQSQPMQVVLCVFVLLDAGIVIAQILLDLHFYREKSALCESGVSRLVEEATRLHPNPDFHFNGENINSLIAILETLPTHPSLPNSQSQSTSCRQSCRKSAIGSQERVSCHRCSKSTRANNTLIQSTGRDGVDDDKSNVLTDNNDVSILDILNSNNKTYQTNKASKVSLMDICNCTEDRALEARNVAPVRSEILQAVAQVDHVNTGSNMVRPNMGKHKRKDLEQLSQIRSKNNKSHHQTEPMTSLPALADASPQAQRHTNTKTEHQSPLQTDGNLDVYSEQEKLERLHVASVSLHLVSIAILGFLVVEDFIKALVMGREFCRHRVEVCDAIIITSSFVLDLVFLEGVSGEEEGKIAVLMIILLLWRIARVVDGIVVTVKQRQELRLRLQKRARRRAEKRLDALEEERHLKSRYIQGLKDLCCRLGISTQEIDARHQRHMKRSSSTAVALSSVAELSVNMTMSISSSLYSSLLPPPARTDPLSNVCERRLWRLGASPNLYDRKLRGGTPGASNGRLFPSYKRRFRSDSSLSSINTECSSPPLVNTLAGHGTCSDQALNLAKYAKTPKESNNRSDTHTNDQDMVCSSLKLQRRHNNNSYLQVEKSEVCFMTVDYSTSDDEEDSKTDGLGETKLGSSRLSKDNDIAQRNGERSLNSSPVNSSGVEIVIDEPENV